ncbi:MAG: hypothetical protein AAFY75_16250 [Pseudomonadota bacterium]
MTRVALAAMMLSLSAVNVGAQERATSDLARDLIAVRHFQTQIDRMIFVAKHRALLPFTGSDLRPDQIEIIRSISVNEWSKARAEVVDIYVEAFARTYSDDALKKLIAFYGDEELQTALAMQASAETRASETMMSLSPLVEARIKTRMTTELSD